MFDGPHIFWIESMLELTSVAQTE